MYKNGNLSYAWGWGHTPLRKIWIFRPFGTQENVSKINSICHLKPLFQSSQKLVCSSLRVLASIIKKNSQCLFARCEFFLIRCKYTAASCEPVFAMAGRGLSPGNSMVRASHRRSEGRGFDSRLELRNIFLSLRSSLSSKQFTFRSIDVFNQFDGNFDGNENSIQI